MKTFGYRNDGKRWMWWLMEDVEEGEEIPDRYYTTNNEGEGVFIVDSRANNRKQIAGTCDFSLVGVKDPKRKIRKYMNV